jgi:4-carboxymuconolactone decarboxylase
MHPLTERMPLPSFDTMSDAQRTAANELIAGPRKGVKGPFIPLLRSPELMSRLQKVGEYLRFHSAVPPRIAEFATLCVARSWSQQFEWVMHVPLALKAGTPRKRSMRSGRDAGRHRCPPQKRWFTTSSAN